MIIRNQFFTEMESDESGSSGDQNLQFERDALSALAMFECYYGCKHSVKG